MTIRNRVIRLRHWIFVSSLLCFFTPLGTYGQIPVSAELSDKKKIDFVNVGIKHKRLQTLSEKNRLSSNLKTLNFADTYFLSLNPENSGSWEETPKGKIWRLGLYSPGAYSIYLSFSSVKLNPGVSLFVYNENYTRVLQPFKTTEQNTAIRYSVPPLKGERIIIELNIPPGMNEFGELALEKLYHDRLNLFGDRKVSKISASSCDENINCDNGTFWQTEKRAVCKIITDGALCTGTLLANTSGDAEPYLLTAYHTIFDEKHAQEAIFFFNYEYPDCLSLRVDDTQSISGASFLSSAAGEDFALLRLNEIPPAGFRPYYAGWNAEEKAKAPGVTIHHPYGKPKQVAISYSHLDTASFSSYNPGSFWEMKWDIGTTEPGSSGAPLFNNRHQLIGSLTGGSSSCGRDGYDYFNKFSSVWKSSENGSSISRFLDPAGLQLKSIEGYDPYGFDPSSCKVAWNIAATERLITFPEDQFNPAAISQLAERFSSPTALSLPSVYFNIGKVNRLSNLDHITLKIWDGRIVPGTELYSETLFLRDLQAGINEIVLDSLVKTSGDFFIGYEANNLGHNQFLLLATNNRGSSGASSAFVFDGSWKNINSMGPTSYSGALAIGISECYGKIYPPQPSALLAYPVPASNHLNFNIPEGIHVRQVKCFDVSGKEVAIQYQPAELKNTIRFELPSGMYLLQVKTDAQVFSTKFTVNTH